MVSGRPAAKRSCCLAATAASGRWSATRCGAGNDGPGRSIPPACPTSGPTTCGTAFASLLLHEGRSVVCVARQLRHSAQLTLGTYGHVMEELADAPRVTAEDAIRAARETGAASHLPIARR